MAEEGFKAFARLLRHYRRAAGLTQEALAERARLSVDTISNMERGVPHVPRADTLDLLAEALGLTEDQRQAFAEMAHASASEQSSGTSIDAGDSVAMVTRGHIPVPPTPLIGRERELATLGALLLHTSPDRPATYARTRLLTLVGPPGVGKTRVGIELARAHANAFRDGAWFVALAPVGAADLVASAIAHTLGLREDGPQPLHERLLDYLRLGHTLIVLDNFEHLLAAAPMVADLLAASPALTVVVTSRAALHLRGEQVFPIDPLPLPDLTSPPEPGTLAQVPAVALFVARAQAVQPSFSLTSVNAETVARICHQLDGLPLALELAAARIPLLGPHALLARLNHRLPLLTQGARDLPPRQQTLRATLSWSYELLTPTEQMLFRRLSVFAGGATLSAIESVCALGDSADTNTAGDTLSAVSALIDYSLLQRVATPEDIADSRASAATEDPAIMPPDDGPRFRLLETLREYGRELLGACGEHAKFKPAHALYFLTLCETAFPYFKGPAQSHWLARLDTDQANVQVALDWFEQQHDCERGLRLAAASWRIWYGRGALAEARRRLDRLLTLDAQGTSIVPVTPALRARALNIAGLLAYWQADYPHAMLCYQQSLALYRVLEDSRSIGGVLNNLAIIAEEQGDSPRATELYEESLALKRQEGDQHDIALALNNLGALARQQGDYTRAIALLEESLALNRAVGDLVGRARSLGNLGNIRREQGDCARARALLEEALALFRRLGDAHGIAYTLMHLAEVASQEADVARAEPLAEEALAQLKTLGDQRAAFALTILAHIACERSEWQRAKALYQESLVLYRQLHRMQGMDACLEGMAWVALSEGMPERAAQLVGAAAAVREQHAIHLPDAERARMERICATVHAALPADEFDKAWTAGQTMPLERAIAETLGETVAASPPDVSPPGTVPAMASLHVLSRSASHNGAGG